MADAVDDPHASFVYLSDDFISRKPARQPTGGGLILRGFGNSDSLEGIDRDSFRPRLKSVAGSLFNKLRFWSTGNQWAASILRQELADAGFTGRTFRKVAGYGLQTGLGQQATAKCNQFLRIRAGAGLCIVIQGDNPHGSTRSVSCSRKRRCTRTRA